MTSPAPEKRPVKPMPTPQIVDKFYELMQWFVDRTQRIPRQYRGTLMHWRQLFQMRCVS